jgi:two-component system, OmpR family, phosphate regulon sensor histidine kinase PhoR
LNMRIRSFKLKLLLSYACVIVVSFGFVAFFLDKSLEENSLHTIQSSLITQAALIENQILSAELQKEDIPSLETLVTGLSAATKCRITIINIQGKVLADSDKLPGDIPKMENHLKRPEVIRALRGAIGSDTRYSPTLKIDMLYVAVPIKDNTTTVGVLRLALTLESVQKTLFGIRRTVFGGLLFALGLAFVLGSLVASRTITPINRMIQASRKFSEGDFSHRIIQPSKDEIGELAATLNAMAEDIENKIKEIKSQNQEFVAIFNSMVEGVIVIDGEGRIVSVNPTVEKIFGVRKNDVKGKLFLEEIRNNDIAEMIHATLTKGMPLSAEITLVYPVQRIFEVSASPMFDNSGVGGCLMVIHDITEIRKLETMRSDFVANVSHELKTPLTSIKGFVETLLEGAIDDKENNRAFLTIIQEHAERLNALVNDLLSLAYLESKEITLDKCPVNMRQMLDTVVAGVSAQLKKKNIELKNEVGSGVLVYADKNRLEQVVTNLIDNAIKFNKENGTIRISAQNENGQVKVLIEDSGLGIPGKDIPRIFERFYRVDKARSRELGGTGLGLSIVKHIVELHGGVPGVESIEGLGSKFFFTLPL